MSWSRDFCAITKSAVTPCQLSGYDDYVDEHNTRLPHSAFRGQTPDEMYFGTGDRIPEELDAAKKVACQSRIKLNRETSCPTCRPLVALAG